MKKFFYPLLLLMAMTFTFTACDDDDVTIPNLTINVPGLDDDGSAEVAQEDTLALTATVTNTPYCLFHWSVDGKKVFEGSTYKFVSSEIGKHVISLKATSVDGGVSVAEVKVEVYGKYKQGTFVLNEGNSSSENGKLTFISPSGKVTEEAYFKANGSHLGQSSQDLYIEDGKIFIISQDNSKGGDGILVVANAETLKKEAAYTEELSTLARPSNLVVVDRVVYIRDNQGIHTFNLDTKELKPVKTDASVSKNRMAEIDDKVYAMADDHLLTLEDGHVVRSMSMGGRISGIVEGDDDILWVALDKQPAEIVKMDGKDGRVLATNEIDKGGLNAGWGASPAISAKGDTIYFSNNTTVIYRHIFSQKKTDVMTDVSEHVTNAKIMYNNLAVHPETGEVYFTSIKGWGNDYLLNNVSVFDFDKSSAPIKNYQNVTAFPAGVFFTENF